MKLGTRIIYQHEMENWHVELVKISTAYGDSMSIYLFIPKNVNPPYQAVIIAPPDVRGGSEHFIQSHWMNAYDFIVKTGRMMVLPIVYNTYDRSHKGPQELSVKTPHRGLITYKEIKIKQVKDHKRTMDYLFSRKDIQHDKVAYYGVSAGGGGGALIMALEDRFSNAVFVVCGLSTRIEKLPETDRANYLPRISKPILILNSKFDWNYPYETSQKPFFELIGTPEKDKKMILYEESGHQLPWKAVMKETLNWYDQYLGKVKKEVAQAD
jgi:dienelactone hydrolase